MSQRGKRQGSRTDDVVVTKRRKQGRTVAVAEEEETSETSSAAPSTSGWLTRSNSDLKMPSIYNRTTTDQPAELFRKDLISAMKLPDNEPLTHDDYWLISDTWKQDWERGVQVPVNPDSLPSPVVTVVTQGSTRPSPHNDFKLPKRKYVKIVKDDSFDPEEHWYSTIPSKADKICQYDLDNVDIAWLGIYNGERALMGHMPLREDQFERIIEELEIRSYDKIQTKLKSIEGLGIEYDENVICDVCRSPDSEESNEMVFCDSCNICVHQACYGILEIPSGSWLCRACSLPQRPECVLCPNKGGAMKSTKSGQKWAHVSCALWIPEVSIGNVETMEPITKISSIPQSRWALICYLCRERVGACIQCSVKTCKTAYHVTCAFKNDLDMRAIIDDERAEEGVKLKSYCEKHGITKKKDNKSGSHSDEDDNKRKKRKDMTSEERSQARAAKLNEIESEFDKYIQSSDIIAQKELDSEAITAIYNYWVLKRRSGGNKPLITPRAENIDLLKRQQEQADLDKMRIFVQLRQDLERVRNLCYMVSRREKLSRTFFRMREQTFNKQISVLSDQNLNLTTLEITAIKEANHGPSIYDKMYSHPGASELSTDFETLLSRIAGVSNDEKITITKDLNGIKKKQDNPYKRMYLNGLERRKSNFASFSSGSDSEVRRNLRGTDTGSSFDEKISKSHVKPLKEKRLSKKRVSSKMIDTSTDDEIHANKSKTSWKLSKNKTLLQIEKELGDKSITDTDEELLPFTSVNKRKGRSNISNIYSDSDSQSSKDIKRSAKVTTKKQPEPKEKHKNKLESKNKIIPKIVKSSKKFSFIEAIDHKNKENLKKSKKAVKDKVPSDLIVPQRQAAKKATESIRGAKSKVDQIFLEQEIPKKVSVPSSEEVKIKQKLHKSNKSKELIKKDKVKESKKNDKVAHDTYEFDKDFCSDSQEIISYVPQRQAAKKAAEHIKTGLHQKTENVVTIPETCKLKSTDFLSSKKKDEVEIKSNEKEDSEKKSTPSRVNVESRKVSKSSVSSSSSSCSSSSSSSSATSCTSSTSSSSSESASEDEEKKQKTPEKRSIFDPPSKDHGKKIKEKRPSVSSNIIKPILNEKPKSILRSSSSSASASSSDSENAKIKKANKKMTPPKQQKLTDKTKSGEQKEVSCNSSKAPDKKLKTSDGRPELGFQRPPFEREEQPVRTQEKASNYDNRFNKELARVASSKATDMVGRRSNSRTPKRDDFSNEKKELHPGKRKSNDSGKISQNLDNNRSPTKQKSSEEKERFLHLTSEAKKNSKKIDFKDSFVHHETELLGSTLEREISERKAGRDNMGKSSSKKSLDRIFEKRDKIIKEKEQKNNFKHFGKLSPIKDISGSKLKHNNNDSEWFKRNSFLDKEIEKPAVGRSLFSPNYEVENKRPSVEPPILSLPDLKAEDVDLNKSNSSPRSVANSLPILSPVNDNILHENKNDDLSIPTLDKMLPTDFQVADPDNLEPKRISSRNSSTSATLNQHRSIFSPQPACKELLDFENDTLAVDDTVSTDAFSLSHVDKPPHLNFSFGNDFLFREDTKEDSARETLNLVEKLRLGYAKKTHAEDRDMDLHDENSLLDLKEEHDKDEDKVAEIISETLPQTLTTNNLAEQISQNVTMPSLRLPENNHKMSDFDLPPKLSKDVHVTPNLPELGRTSNLNCNVPSTLSNNIVPSTLPQHFSGSLSQSLMENMNVKHSPPPPTLQPEVPLDLIHQEIKVENNQLDKAIDPEEVERTIDLIKQNNMIEEAALHIASDPNLLQHLGQDKPHDIPSSYEQTDHFEHYASPYGLPISDSGKIPGREKLDRSNSGQADERWVPPSSVPPPSVRSYEHAPSPYRNKWAENELMPSRHSSSSSVSSTSSQRDESDLSKSEDLIMQPPSNMNSGIPELQAFHSNMPYNPSCALSSGSSFHFTDSHFPVNSMSVFHGHSQMPYSTDSSMFSGTYPGVYPTSQSMQQKMEETLQMHPPPLNSCAAFTTPSQNLAIADAMISPLIQDPPSLNQNLPFGPECQQLTPTESPLQPHDVYNQQPGSQASQLPPTPTTISEPPTPKTPGSEKKSPSKPTRTQPSRFVTQQQISKSPTKSPGKSPRQGEPVRGRGSGKRGRPPGSGKGSTSNSTSRGRGRGRGRGRPPVHGYHGHHGSHTVNSNLAGTVYDFDFDEDDEGRDGIENLRAMRERRKSSDIHDNRKSIDSNSYIKESPNSPSFSSPNYRQRFGEVKDLKPPSPMLKSSNDKPVEMVPPVLPGPVDMRTYSTYDASASSTTYNNNLMDPYSTGNEQNVNDYVDELVEEFDQSLAKKKQETKHEEPTKPKLEVDEKEKVKLILKESVSSVFEPIKNEIETIELKKEEELSNDSRNQLKVKIKGPFLDASYAQVNTVPQVQPVSSTIQLEIPSASNNSSNTGNNGTSNLRRMRKKELLRQYWTQDMNMDETTNVSAPIPQSLEPVKKTERPVVTIPKAIASMTSIPTREDYKSIVDANEKASTNRKKKDKCHIDTFEDFDRKKGISAAAEAGHQPKRRGRIAKQKETINAPASAPKLKIKIGNDITQASVTPIIDDKKNLRIRPPKKRLNALPKPSIEEMKRESMKFRRKVMAGFDEEEKEEEEDEDISIFTNNRKRKKQRSAEGTATSIRVIGDGDHSAPKLIIRFGKKIDDKNMNCETVEIRPDKMKLSPTLTHTSGIERTKSVNSDSADNRTSKPIRLKLSRCEEGYVMKEPNRDNSNINKCSINKDKSTDNNSDNPSQPPPPTLPLSKDCEESVISDLAMKIEGFDRRQSTFSS